MFKKTLLAFCVGAACTVGSTASMAAAEVWVRTAPPAPRVEVMPAPRRGYEWVPGHWVWQRNHHVWQSGTWVRGRQGYAYVAPTWVERDGRWHMQSGQWSRRDRDGDGVPNAVDRHPNNPNRN